MLPGVARQAGFGACLRREFCRVPIPFCGDLRQQETSAAAELDYKAVPSDLDLGNIDDAFDWSQHGNFEIDAAPFWKADGRKARITGGGRHGASLDDLDQQQLRVRITDAAAEPIADPQGDERAGSQPPRNQGFGFR